MNHVLLCYVPGLDLRRLDSRHAPFLAEAMQRFPTATLDGLPSSELLSTLVTGAMPHENGIWQTLLRPRRALTRRERLTDSLADSLTVAAQCVRHQLRHDCDVPTLPPWRRRRFEWRRIKFRGRASTSHLIESLGGVPSIAEAVGRARFRYRFTDRIHDRERLLDEVGRGDVPLEVLQFHAMDAMGHWHFETPEEFRHYYGLTDAFLSEMRARCADRGVMMVLVSDHGQETVRRSQDLAREIRALDVPRDEFAFFLQAIMARFWFHTERARRAVLDLLARTPDVSVLANEELRRYGIAFENDDFGEVYAIADPGTLFFPTDFHHPLVNAVMGLKDWQQRKRVRNPRHLGYHGYLPEHPSEKGFMTVFDDRFPLAGDSFHLRDVAPTIVRLVGAEPPPYMSGRAQLLPARTTS